MKISSPHKNNFVPPNQAPTYSDITIEDIRKAVNDLDIELQMIQTSDLGNGKVKLSGNGIFGIVPKKEWSDALMKAASKYLKK